MAGLCDTCQKLVVRGQRRGCAVLKVMVGREGDCFAYTDDPDWERKVEAAVKDYTLRARPVK